MTWGNNEKKVNVKLGVNDCEYAKYRDDFRELKRLKSMFESREASIHGNDSVKSIVKLAERVRDASNSDLVSLMTKCYDYSTKNRLTRTVVLCNIDNCDITFGVFGLGKKYYSRSVPMSFREFGYYSIGNQKMVIDGLKKHDVLVANLLKKLMVLARKHSKIKDAREKPTLVFNLASGLEAQEYDEDEVSSVKAVLLTYEMLIDLKVKDCDGDDDEQSVLWYDEDDDKYMMKPLLNMIDLSKVLANIDISNIEKREDLITSIREKFKRILTLAEL